MARVFETFAKIAFTTYCVIAIGAVWLSLAHPPWQGNMDALLGFVVLVVAALPWSYAFMLAVAMLDRSLDLPRGMTGDLFFSAMNVGFVFLNLGLLYWIAFKRDRKGGGPQREA
jgi:hypothetical protein